MVRFGRRGRALSTVAPCSEVFGDSSRGGEWAAVRLRVDGDRIVEADAPGLERDLAGLTLLEAAAVGGETLAVDALANALGPVFRAEPSPGRVAVAMSGGVDSAVALLRSLPNAVGVTLRLWLDPDGPDSERACCSPEQRDRGARDVPPPRRPARDARPARGVPPRGRRAVRARLRARRDAEPVHRAATAASASPSCSRSRGAQAPTRLATGHYARIVERDGRLLLARGADPAKDQSYMLAALDPRKLARVSFPLGEQDKEATRAEAERAGLAAARKPESQEACFLAGDDYRAFLGRQGLEPRRRRDRRRGRERARPPRRLLALHARPARAASASPRPSRSTSSARSPPRTPSSSARASRSRAPRSTARGRLYADVERASRRSSATARPRSGARVEPTRPRLPARARRAGVRRRAGPGSGALRRRRRRRLRPDHGVALRSDADAGRGIQLGGPLAARARRLPVRRRNLARVPARAPGRNRSAGFRRSSGERESLFSR